MIEDQYIVALDEFPSRPGIVKPVELLPFLEVIQIWDAISFVGELGVLDE